MLNLPASAAFERRIPKQKFYANLTVTPELRRCFTEQIESITWADKLAPQTMNLAAGQRVQEIEVFRIRLAGDTLDGKVTELMDKQIPYHILFVLTRPDGMLRLLMNYKEAAPGGGFTLRQRCATGWLAPDTVCLPCWRRIWTPCTRALCGISPGTACKAPPGRIWHKACSAPRC